MTAGSTSPLARPRVRRKWRPPLALVVYSVLFTVMIVPVLLLLWFRATALNASPVLPSEIGAFVTVILFTLTIGYVLVRAIKAPLDALVQRSNDIARHGRTAIQPLDSYGTREIATLTQSFLDLAGQLVERTDYVRTFAAHVSHELKSPLTAIAGAAELLREADTDDAPMPAEQRARFLDNIVSDARRLDRLLVRLRELAHAEMPITTGESSLSVVIDRIAGRFPELVIHAPGNDGKPIALPVEALAIVLTNLAENALQAGATRLVITHHGTDDHELIRVEDNGRGVAADVQETIFRPFFTTRAAEGGTGMGLQIIEALLAAHRSTIRLDHRHTAGAAFEITIPKNA
jgi:signal transduction histidine kinase